MIYTTLNKIRAHRPCENGWKKLLKHLGKTNADDEPLGLDVILDSNGIVDTLWCLRTLPEHDNLWREYAIWCAQQVRHIMTDPRSLAAIDIAEQYVHGQATGEELENAQNEALRAEWERIKAVGPMVAKMEKLAEVAAMGAASWVAKLDGMGVATYMVARGAATAAWAAKSGESGGAVWHFFLGKFPALALRAERKLRDNQEKKFRRMLEAHP